MKMIAFGDKVTQDTRVRAVSEEWRWVGGRVEAGRTVGVTGQWEGSL